MKHTACGGWFELRTDPKNSDFVVVEGAKRRNYGAEEVGPSTLFDEAQKKRQDAFEALEDKRDKKIQLKEEAIRVQELQSLQERDWKFSDERNQKLRNQFRAGRKEREKDQARKDQIQNTMGLALELLEEESIDARRAKLVDFGSLADEEFDGSAQVRTGVFQSNDAHKVWNSGASKQQKLQEKLMNNTRQTKDPFGATFIDTSARLANQSKIPGIKRKRSMSNSESNQLPRTLESTASASLVNYDSD